jgi:FG-GAP repeat
VTNEAFGFGDSLRYEDGTLAVGTNALRPGGSIGSDKPGAVYVFVRNGTGKFVRTAKLVPSDSAVGDGFGVDISMAGSVMVVGAVGAAYVFRRNSSGVWRQHQKLIPADSRAGGFGAAVAIDRGMIIVGAPFTDYDGNPEHPSGAAYGFVPTAGLWVETFKLQPRPDEIEQFKRFGQRIAMFDKHIAVLSEGGFLSDDVGDVPHEVFVFTYTRSEWSVIARGVAEGFNITNPRPSLALANNWILLGLPCQRELFCSGEAAVFDFNRFQD